MEIINFINSNVGVISTIIGIITILCGLIYKNKSNKRMIVQKNKEGDNIYYEK